MNTASNQNSLFEDPYLGMVIDGSIIERKLGQGGMGAVYQARHLTLEKYVAIKILPPEFSIVPQNVERFLREARSAAKLEHPNIVQVYNAGQENNVHFISMQFVSGQSLQSYIHKLEKIPLAQTLWIMKYSMQGLLFAHEHGIIHRDIKPDNIMLMSSGEVKVVDFGLARSSEAGNTLSNPGQIFGTPHFMSPEQCTGEVLDLRTDIYSLGIMFYYMLSGNRPYDGGQAVYILMLHANTKEPTKLLDTEQLQIPLELVRLIRKMMEKDREQRYQSLAEVLQALEPILLKYPPVPLFSTEINSPPPRREPSGGNLVVTAPSDPVSSSQTPVSNVYSHPTTSPSMVGKDRAPARKAQVNPPSPLSDYVPPTKPSTHPPSPSPKSKERLIQSEGLIPTTDTSTPKSKGRLTQSGIQTLNTEIPNSLRNTSKTMASRSSLEKVSTQGISATPRPKVSDPHSLRGFSKKLVLTIFLISILGVGLFWFQKKSREIASQKQVVFTQEESERLKQETPIDFEAIRELFVQLQKQYPESQVWCIEQTKNLAQEEKNYQQKTLREGEQNLRTKNPIDFEKLRDLYQSYGQKYNSEMAWCQEKIKDFYHEEIELLLQEKRLVEASALLANPFWKQISRDRYLQLISRLNLACNELYGNETQFLVTISSHELDLLKLYHNIILLGEPELLGNTSIVLTIRSEALFKKILTITETAPMLVFLECFSFAAQIRNDPLRPILMDLWKEKMAHPFLSIIQGKITAYAIEDLNRIFERLGTLRENSAFAFYFQILENTFIAQIRLLSLEENTHLKINLATTLFPKIFPQAWDVFNGERVIASTSSSEKKPPKNQEQDPESTEDPNPAKRDTAYLATAEELRTAVEDLRQKFQSLIPFPPIEKGPGNWGPPPPMKGRPPHEDPEVQQLLKKVQNLFKKFLSQGNPSDSEFASLKSKIESKLLNLPPPLNDIFSNF